ncbi:POTE ankyrin domain family member J-like isoform X2 [Planococcus citri]|uniref:POTE ankyrin domain family member J-like isoform X2 n=1 Tax=Planococcus citri TaxID=170843 RepID=UPI0031F84CE4
MKKALRKWMKNFNSAEGSPDNSKTISPNATHTPFSSRNESSAINDFVPNKQMKLHYAVLSENETDVRKYSPKCVNNLDSLLRTPLHLAVHQGNLNIANILLENGSSLDLVDSEGYTPFLRGGDYPIHVAIQNESVSTVKLLLEFGASVDVSDANRKSPLLLSIEMGNLSLVELFLKRKVNLEHKDMNGKSAKDYIASSNNINMKLLFSRFISANDFEISPIVHDEDSPTSEQSCVLPPALKSPLSWNILQKSINPNDKATSSAGAEKRKKWVSELHSKTTNKTIQDTISSNPPFVESSKSKYERNAKSLSFEVGNDVFDLKTYNRSYSLNSHEIFNQTKFITLKPLEIDNRSSHEKLKDQLENCQKALQELSLDVISKDSKQLPSPELKFNSDFLLDDFNLKSMNSTHRDMLHDLFLNDENHRRDHSDVESDLRNVTINIENVSSGSKMNEDNRGEKQVDDESSDEDPPFWKSSLDGGYFVPKIRREDTLRTVKSSSGSEDSGSEKDLNLKEAPNSIILNRLKQVSLENEDLETETAVLREATEKLKYDLANYRQLNNVKETNLSEITSQLTQMDLKYSKAIEKINIFQLCMNNLEQEVAHLRHICNKSYKVNQQLMKQLQQMHESNQRIKSEKDEIVNLNASDVQKLQADVLYWKNRYEELLQSKEQTNLAAFEMQSLFKLNLELNKMSDKIRDCLCKSDLAKLQDQQVVLLGQTLQQILNEADHKLQNSLSELKEDVKRKVNEMDHEFSSKTETELKLMDLENVKQKLLLETSKLSTKLKEKEIEETKLKEQLEAFTKEKQKLKEEKRKQLIKKSYEDKNTPRKGVYLSVVRNYLHKSRLNNSDSSPEPFLNENLKIDFRDESMAKESEQKT